MSRKHPVPREEQIRLVYECRNSGLSDSQWCRQHGIATSTFSNWVGRNKKRGDIIPDPVSAGEFALYSFMSNLFQCIISKVNATYLIDDVVIKNEEVAPFKNFWLKVYNWNLCNHCSTCYVCSVYG